MLVGQCAFSEILVLISRVSEWYFEVVRVKRLIYSSLRYIIVFRLFNEDGEVGGTLSASNRNEYQDS
jgi:hypothetical protein